MNITDDRSGLMRMRWPCETRYYYNGSDKQFSVFHDVYNRNRGSLPPSPLTIFIFIGEERGNRGSQPVACRYRTLSDVSGCWRLKVRFTRACIGTERKRKSVERVLASTDVSGAAHHLVIYCTVSRERYERTSYYTIECLVMASL